MVARRREHTFEIETVQANLYIMKPFLLIAGYTYYPSRGTGNWRGTYGHYDQAEVAGRALECDWYEIVDLRDWLDMVPSDDYGWSESSSCEIDY